jgi:hypothetical protein
MSTANCIFRCVFPIALWAKLRNPRIRKRGDVRSWKALWKVLKSGRNTSTRNLTVFQKIIFANAQERGT